MKQAEHRRVGFVPGSDVDAVSEEKLLQCPYCPHKTTVLRSHRKNAFERFVSLFGRLPYA